MSVFETIDVDVLLEKEFAVDRQQAFDPFRFTGVPGWRVGWQDHLSLCLHRGTVGSALILEDALRDTETAISNYEQHVRLRQSKHILLDAQVFEVFYRHPGLFQGACKGKPGSDERHVYFNGTEIVSPDGVVHIACLYRFQGYLRYKFERLTHTTRGDITSLVIADHPFK